MQVKGQTSLLIYFVVQFCENGCNIPNHNITVIQLACMRVHLSMNFVMHTIVTGAFLTSSIIFYIICFSKPCALVEILVPRLVFI